MRSPPGELRKLDELMTLSCEVSTSRTKTAQRKSAALSVRWRRRFSSVFAPFKNSGRPCSGGVASYSCSVLCDQDDCAAEGGFAGTEGSEEVKEAVVGDGRTRLCP